MWRRLGLRFLGVEKCGGVGEGCSRLGRREC